MTEIQKRVLAILKTGEITTTPKLAQEAGCAQRTVYRTIRKLRDLGHPIIASPGRGGGTQYRNRKRRSL